MYISSFCKLIRTNVFLFSQHCIKGIKEFENTRVRVSPCGQFRQPFKDRVTLWSCYSFHETSQKPNHRRNTLPPATFTDEIFRQPPFRPKSTPTRAPPSDLPSGRSLIGKYLPMRPHPPISGPALKFTLQRV